MARTRPVFARLWFVTGLGISRYRSRLLPCIKTPLHFARHAHGTPRSFSDRPREGRAENNINELSLKAPRMGGGPLRAMVNPIHPHHPGEKLAEIAQTRSKLGRNRTDFGRAKSAEVGPDSAAVCQLRLHQAEVYPDSAESGSADFCPFTGSAVQAVA